MQMKPSQSVLRCLKPGDYRRMAWKNGGGTTTEVAVHPEGAGLDAFAWRVSIADIDASGPFSAFRGCDRLIVQLEGAPMTLTHEGAPAHRLARLVPYPFAGELETACTLDAPPARDFNVITRRSQARANVAAQTLPARDRLTVATSDEDVALVFVSRGSAAATMGDESVSATAGHTLVARGPDTLEITAGSEGATILVVEIDLKTPAHPPRR